MGLNELQVCKIDRAFRQLDVNSNGYIEHEDIQALSSRLIISYGEAPSTVKGRAVLDTFDGIWKTLCAAVNTNKDGRISRDEFQSGMDNTFISGTKYDSVFHPASQAILNLCDTDDDGTLSPDEFMKLQEVMGTTPDGGRAAFNALDRDNSNTLDVDELLVAVKEFYTSSDSNAAGNQLYGPL